MNETISETGEPQSTHAVSLFGTDANANDFPVLKAFQEYIDAEQAKARKRMLGLSVFFILLLAMVVITFTLVTMSILNRNQNLSDRLLDLALRERLQPQPVVNVQPAPPVAPQPAVSQEGAFKPLLEKLESLATALTTARQQPIAPAPVVVTAPVAAPVQADTERIKAELKKQQDLLAKERQRLKEAEEKLRQAEVEKHRRRLYPEYYARQARRPVAPPPEEAEPPRAAPPPRVKESEEGALGTLKPIDYFSADDDAELADLVKRAKPKKARTAPSVPVPAPSPVKTETLSVGERNDTIPWLIEQR
jgi:hypothetical protein